MKLYKYEINYSNQLTRIEEEGFEEKSKTYCRKKGYPLRVRKIDIGILENGFIRPKLLLTEKDDEKAKIIFIDYYQNKLDAAIESCQRYENLIGMLKS